MRKSKYTKELLEPLVKEFFSYASILKKLGLKLTGGNYRYLKHKIIFHQLDTSHFKGQGWSKGLNAENESINKIVKKISRSDDAIFIINSPENNGHRLTKRLLRLGWEYKCLNCGLKEWLGKPLTLDLDHKNGIPNDNRFINLRFLCPNCHTQTETWGNKKDLKKK